MEKVYKRLLIFFIGIPVIFGLVLLSFCNHLVVNLIIMVFAGLGANEFYNMLSPSHKLFPKPLIILLTVIQPVCSYIFVLLGIDSIISSWVLIFEILALMGIECFVERDFPIAVSKLSLSILIILYCGFMFSFIIRLTGIEEYSNYYIILFLLIVFMCDSLAWFFGILFGKSTRGYVPASPNKSLVGFIGGIFGSIISAVLFKFLFPEVLPGSFLKIILLSGICGVAAIIGDLIESIFKRSCNVKDSGTLIPGRGGVLDSIDSLLATAPIFYTLFHFLYQI